MLARVVERDGEMALRSALGATRGRLIREGLVQTLVPGCLWNRSWITRRRVAHARAGRAQSRRRGRDRQRDS